MGAGRRQALSCAVVCLAAACATDDAAPDAGARERGRARADAASGGPSAARPDMEADAGARDAEAEPDAGDAGQADAGGADAGAEPRTERVSLIDPGAFAALSAKDDPFRDRPDEPHCTTTGYGLEDFSGMPSFGVDTARCAYVTARQPSRVDVVAGEELAVGLWFFDLFGPPGAMAHIVLRLGTQTLLEERVPIPATSTLLRQHIVVARDIPAGTPVTIHIHNHGANQYYLLELSTGPEGT